MNVKHICNLINSITATRSMLLALTFVFIFMSIAGCDQHRAARINNPKNSIDADILSELHIRGVAQYNEGESVVIPINSNLRLALIDLSRALTAQMEKHAGRLAVADSLSDAESKKDLFDLSILGKKLARVREFLSFVSPGDF